VVNQRYDPEVQNPSGFLGNNVLMRCNVPSFVRDHVTVTSWLQEPVFNIYPSTMGGKQLNIKQQFVVYGLRRFTTRTSERNYSRTEYRIILFGMKYEKSNYSKIIVTFYRARILGIVVN